MPGFVDESGIDRNAIEDITINRGRPRQICGNCIYSFYKRIVRELDNEGGDYLNTGVVPFTTGKSYLYRKESGIYDIYRFYWKENILNETVIGEIYCYQDIKEDNGGYSLVFVIIRVICAVDGDVCFIEPYSIKGEPHEMKSGKGKYS